jgi:hypothetical protein
MFGTCLLKSQNNLITIITFSIFIAKIKLCKHFKQTILSIMLSNNYQFI